MTQAADCKKIVIVGAGFGGIYTTLHLESLCRRRRDIEVTLINKQNYFLMTPLLFEAGSGVLEPRHAVNPIRKLLRTTRFVQAQVQQINFERCQVIFKQSAREPQAIEYDQLVIALGGVTNLQIIPGAQQAMTFKTMADAIFLRNHVIELFEQADVELDAARKKRLLTFIVVGAGLVGVELMGELTEFTRSLAGSYPRINPDDFRFELIEAGPRILPELEPDLAEYAAKVLTRRNVRVRLSSPVSAIEGGSAQLAEESIRAETIVVATGVSPNPILAQFEIAKDRKGRLEVDATMRSTSRPNVWALGDCAAIPDPTGKPYPALAQHAIREARVLADNILAAIDGQPTKPFVYKTLGTLAALGRYKGVGRIWKFKVRGFVAWWIWRTYYLLQMPRWSRRIRIMMDWTITLLFHNDVVELDMFRAKEETRSGPSR